MSTDPAGIPAMIPTATGYNLVPPQPRHRAVTDTAHLALNRRGSAYFQVTGLIDCRFEPGRHVNPVQSPAALADEEAAKFRAHRYVVNLLRSIPRGLIRDV